MPRDWTRDRDGVRFSPYNCNSNKKKNNSRNCEENRRKSCDLYEKEKDRWEESTCPICMDHPHKAVLLICSSHEKGCRPYLCDTSHLLSNCFKQFCELYSVTASKSTGRDYDRDDQPNKFVNSGGRVRELVCPLCRGQISGWTVVEGARKFMNKLVRGCAMESCDFSGNYVELKKHAKLEHPSARPSRVNKEQQQNWRDEEDELDETNYNTDDEELDGSDEDNWIPLRPGDNFFNHIHFAHEDEILTEEYSVSNGIRRYKQKTKSGRTFEFAEIVGEN